jgi:hypothetical protein
MSAEKITSDEDRRRVAVEAFEVLTKIEAGEISISADGATWDEVFDGNVRFLAGNGWRFTVYLDIGDWDYFDRIISVDGVELDFGWIADNSHDLFEWEPIDSDLWRCAPPNLQGPI